ncbi:MAG: hypothetical protein AB2792_20185 [Candidatus Thiodiazotropha sp.]
MPQAIPNVIRIIASQNHRKIFQKGGGRGRGMENRDVSGGRGRGGGGRDTSFRTLQVLFNVSDNLIVEHEDPLFLIITGDGRKQRIYTDNRGASVSISGGMDQKVVTAGWEKNVLVVETTSDSGPRVVQHYTLNTDSFQLVVSTIFKPSESSEVVSINRIYDSVPTHTTDELSPD